MTMRRKMETAASLLTAERRTARRGSRESGFSQVLKKKRVMRSPAPSIGPWTTRSGTVIAGAKVISSAASKTCSLPPK
ncbi:hypothetical protein GCM10010400_47780 [Streptomyces aculeolatus]